MGNIHLIVSVKYPDRRNQSDYKEVFHTGLDYDEGVQIPFTELYQGLRLLFPRKDAIVCFSV